MWKNRVLSILKPVSQGMGKVFSKLSNFSRLYFAKTRFSRTKFDPIAWFDRVNQKIKKRNAAFYGKAITILVCSYFLADLAALGLGRFIPEPPPVRTPRDFGQSKKTPSLEEYNTIFARNLFNSKGLIPGDSNGTNINPNGPAVKSSLPFNLVGTLIMQNELRSIATIEDKAASLVYPVRVEDEIPGKARITAVEARRVIFINVQSNRLEFIELPEDLVVSNPRITVGKPAGGPAKPGDTAIERVSGTQFNVARSEVDKALSDFNNILTQARAVPNFENGVPSGYKLFQIVPGSIYDKLGLQNGDTISGLNGQGINDPAKAFEMLTELKTSNHLELQVKRDGKPMNYIYDIR